MSAGKREIGDVVVEENIGIPSAGVMALGAVMREIVGFMIGIIGVTVVGLMARPAIGRRAGVAGGMAIQAVQGYMSTCQGKFGLIMVEGGRFPAISSVTPGTILGEVIGFVIGIAGISIVVLMTCPAICRRTRILAIRMT